MVLETSVYCVNCGAVKSRLYLSATALTVIRITLWYLDFYIFFLYLLYLLYLFFYLYIYISCTASSFHYKMKAEEEAMEHIRHMIKI